MYVNFDENLAVLGDIEFDCLLICNITRLSVLSGQILEKVITVVLLRSIGIK